MSSLKKNFFYNIAYQVLMIILPLITAPYLSRNLGVEGIGTYSYIYSIAYYFGLCGMLGVSNHGNRSVALAKGNCEKLSEVFSNVYIIQLTTTAIALLLYLLYIGVFLHGNRMIALLATLFVISYMLDINWFFFGLEQFKLTVTRNVVIKIVSAICIFIFVKKPEDLWKYMVIMAMGAVLGQIYLWFNIKKIVVFVKPAWGQLKEHIKPILILFIPIIAYSIYKVMDKIMLGALTSVTQVGLYESADKIINIPIGIITAFGTVMMPRMSALVANRDTEHTEIYNQLSFKYFSIIAVGMMFGLMGVSKILAPVYFGNEFSDCTAIIIGLSITLIFVTWANIIRTQYLIPNKKDKVYVISTLAGAVINLVFNIIFIPIFQAIGALIGTVLAEFTVFFVQALMVKGEFKVGRYLKTVVVYFVFGIGMAAIVWLLGENLPLTPMTLVMQVIVGVVVYSGAVAFYLYFTKDKIMLSILSRLKRRK